MRSRKPLTPRAWPSDFWIRATLVAGFLATGCTESSDADPDATQARADARTPADATDGSADSGPGFLPGRVGFINIIENSPYHENGFGLEGLRAELNDAPWVPHAERIAGHGSCALFGHRRGGFCDPPCDEQFCTADDVCVPYPTRVDAGRIEVSGLAAPLSFIPSENGYAPSYTDFGGETFADDAEITATAAGGEIPGFTLQARGLPPVEATRFSLELSRDEERVVTWTSANAGRIQVALRHGWHGMPYDALLVCEVDDLGELAIPTQMANAYMDLVGSGDVHYWWITRFDRDVIETAHGPVELFVGNFFYVPQLL